MSAPEKQSRRHRCAEHEVGRQRCGDEGDMVGDRQVPRRKDTAGNNEGDEADRGLGHPCILAEIISRSAQP